MQRLQQLVSKSSSDVDASTQLGMQAAELRSLVAASWQVPDKKLASMRARIAKHFVSNPQLIDRVG